MAKKKKTETLSITFAKKGDEVHIAWLIAALAEYEKAPKQNVSTPESVREQLFKGKPAGQVLLARFGNEVVGFALFFPNFSTWLCRQGMYLEDLFVLPEYREKGVGRALLERLAQICVERGYGRFEWSCLEWNELAKGMYRRLGAEELVEWRTWRMTGDSIKALAEGNPQPISKAPTPPPPPPAEEETPADLFPEEPKVPKNAETVVIYTDGGCQPNPGVGAWAAVLQVGTNRKELCGGEMNTTNNRMEMLAAINALEALKRPCRVEVHTDSQYLRDGITKWIHGWKRKNWRKKGGGPVLNDDLWKRLDVLIQKHEVKWAWVPGHAGVLFNERCDELCSAEIKRLMKKKR